MIALKFPAAQMLHSSQNHFQRFYIMIKIFWGM